MWRSQIKHGGQLKTCTKKGRKKMTPLASYRFLLRHCQKTISTSNSAGKNAAFVVCKFRRQTKQIKLVATLFTAKLGRKNCRLYIGSI
jgi:hypothetical protein